MHPFPLHVQDYRYSLLPSRKFGEYTFGIEDMRGIVALVAPMVASFKSETSDMLRWTPPDANALIERQGRGYLTFTVRQGDALVGLCFARRLMAGAIDAGMYLAPEHRRGLLAVRLAQFVQDAMARLGAEWMAWECDESSRSFLMAEYLGHELITRRYIANLRGEDIA
jgi:hypothetical protein